TRCSHWPAGISSGGRSSTARIRSRTTRATPARASGAASTTSCRRTSPSSFPFGPRSNRQPRTHMRTNTLIALVLAAGSFSVGCKGYLDVSNPGPIEDAKLQTPDAAPALVVGMSADYANVYDEMVRISAIASDELGHGGSYTQEGLWVRGIIKPDDVN